MEVLELARMEELADCAAIIEGAKLFQREQGFDQWKDDYPNADSIAQDIRMDRGYVLRVEGKVAGYLCVDLGGEPAYDEIRGEWHLDAPYAVVHRMAFHRDFRGRGLSDTAFSLVEDLCREKGVPYIRIDTDPRNQRMQHILKKNGFVYCGTILYLGEKLAFDKILQRVEK